MDLQKMGLFLKDLRKKGLTQEELAEKFYVSSRSISRWERGSNMPDIEVLLDLADFYGVDLVEILNGSRRSEMKNEERERNIKVAEYEKENNNIFLKLLRIFLLVSFLGSVLGYFLEKLTPSLTGKTLDLVEFVLGFFQGFTMAFLLLGLLYSFGIFKSDFFKKFKGEKSFN